MNNIPVLFNDVADCCGCTACYAICPKHAIIMVIDESGFNYPKIEKEKCIRCQKCINVCPIKKYDKQKDVTLRLE